ncbi:OmpA family protein [Spartinivicinus ruber]|uniref:OmpA family protein n=1 Tax=Spartinivicinus ruber TaxID=2683272 RepID=UPI0013D15BC9|nr:OmpA family protein [Spartinivicinus ruber]
MSSKKLAEVHALKTVYLLSGIYDTQGVVSGTARPLINTLFIAKSPVVDKKDKTALLATNDDGYINRVDGDFTQGSRIRNFSKEEATYFYFPPVDTIAKLFAIYGQDSFLEKIEECITSQQLKKSKGIKLNTKITGDLLEKPSEGDKGKHYESWYNAHKSKVIEGFILPRVKVVILSFSKNSIFNDATIEMWKHNEVESDSKIKGGMQKDDNETPVFITIDTEGKNINEGLYNIRIIFSDDAKGDIENSQYSFTKNKLGFYFYELKEQIKFDIRNPTADICMLNADPIHLEEALIKQFPEVFRDVIKITRDMTKGKIDGKTAGPGLTPYLHDMKVRHEYSALAEGIMTSAYTSVSSGKVDTPGLIDNSTKLIDTVLTDQGYTEAALVMRIGFEAKAIQATWQGLQTALKDQQTYANNLKKIQRIEAMLTDGALHPFRQQSLANIMEKIKYENYVNFEKFKQVINVREWLNPSKFAIRDAQKVVDKVAQEYVMGVKFSIPPRYVHFGTRAFGAYQFVTGLSGLVDSYKNLDAKLKSAEESKSFYDDVIKSYKEQIGESITPEIKKIQNDLLKIGQATHAKKAKVTGGFKDGRYVIRTLITFNLDKHETITLPLESVANLIKSDEKVTLSLYGHACPIGTDKYNYDLSKARTGHIHKQFTNAGVPADRIEVAWYGETQPLRDKERKVDFVASRRVEVVLSVPGGELIFRPSREAMQNLEQARQLQVNAYFDYHQAQIEMLWAIFDAACGIAAMFPQTMLIANCLMLFKDASKALVSATEYIDDLLGDNLLNEYIDYHRLEKDIGTKSLYNRKFIQIVKQDEKQVDYLKFLNNQYRIRAEVLNSLIKLIIRAAYQYKSLGYVIMNGGEFSPNYAEYKKQLEKLHIDKFINFFVLNSEWSYPHDNQFHYPLDQFWMDYLGMPDVWDNSGEYKVDKSLLSTKFEESSKNVMRKNWMLHSSRLRIPIPMPNFDEKMMLANFQSCFPIHGVGSPSIESLMMDLDINYAGMDISIYKYTGVYIKPAIIENNPEWMPLVDYLQSLESKDRSVSPFDEIRVIIVLKKDEEYTKEQGKPEHYLERAIPVSLRPVRMVNAFAELEGPVYTDVTQKLTDIDLLPEESQFKGHYGCVFYLRYRFGERRIIPGIKPMTQSQLFDFFDKSEWNSKTNKLEMQYKLEVTVGRNRKTTRPIRVEGTDENFTQRNKDILDGVGVTDVVNIGGAVAKIGRNLYDNYKVAESFNENFCLSINPDRSKALRDEEGNWIKNLFPESYLFDKDFMLSKERDYQFPKLFSGLTAVAPMFRVAEQGSFFISAKYAYGLSGTKFSGKNDKADHKTMLKEFDWNDKVELGLLAFVEKIDEEMYKKMGHSWQQLTCAYDLSEEGDTSTVGPTVNTTLTYLGTLKVDAKLKTNSSGGYMGIATVDIIIDESNYTFIASKLAENQSLLNTYQLAPMLSMLNSSDSLIKKQLLEIIKPHISGKMSATVKNKMELHVYASVENLSYKTPAGYEVDGLRPFGKKAISDGFFDWLLGADDKVDLKTNKMHDFKFWIKNLRSQGKSGLSDKHVKKYDDGLFYIPAPKNFADPKTCPWARDSDDPKEREKAKSGAFDLTRDKRWVDKVGTVTPNKLPNLPTTNNAIKWYFYGEFDKSKGTNYRKMAIKKWVEDGVSAKDPSVLN